MKLSTRQWIGRTTGTVISALIVLLYPLHKCNAPDEESAFNLSSWHTEQVKKPENVPSCWTENEWEQCAIKEFSNEISREEAKKLILEGKVTNIFQAHNLEVRLTTEEGSFSTREPKIDEVWKIWKTCGNRCTKIQLATE